MHLDLPITLAGLIVGLVVGMTGMGGGALMTPILVLFFNVQPLAAVSSDLVASFVMKPIGAGVHLRRRTLHAGLVGWLMLGSVPAAFAGVLVIRALGNGRRAQDVVQIGLGIALLIAAGTLILKVAVSAWRRRTGVRDAAEEVGAVTVRRAPTLLVGALGGLVVGMTSVGSGSLIIAALLFLYPRLPASRLVGTDLVQAIPLVGSAALGHMLFGDFRLGLTATLLVGSIPGVYLGALISSRAPSTLLRRVLAVVLLASGLKLLQVGNLPLLAVLAASLAAAAGAGGLERIRAALVSRANGVRADTRAPAHVRTEA